MLFAASFYGASDNIKAAIIAFAGVAGVAIYKNSEIRKREINARHFAEKREAYMTIIDIFFELIEAQKKQKNLSSSQLQKKMTLFKKRMIVWGGCDVIQAWNELEMRVDADSSSRDLVVRMEKILRAIREDLGHDDSLLEFGQLWGLILTVEGKKELFGEDFGDD